MGNYLVDYRVAIGLFNQMKISTGVSSIGVSSRTVFYIMLLMSLLLLCGDIEQNPGPVKLKSLSMCHANIRGLSNVKLSAMRTTFCKYFDVITLSETFLSLNCTTDLSIAGYHDIIRKDRDSFGGGVAMYIKDNIIYKRHYNYECRLLENMWIELTTCEGKLFICTIYRPPNFVDFWDYLDANIEQVKTETNGGRIVIIGDMNADFNTHHGNRLLNLCNMHNFTYHINEPTRITSHSKTCLDQILSNIPINVSSSFVQAPVSTNDHCTIGIEFNFKIITDPPYYRHVWQYDKGDYDGFRTALSSADWDACFQTQDVNTVCTNWTQTFLNIARMYIPHRVVLIRPRDSPWFTGELRTMKRKLIRLYRIAKTKMSEFHWNKYKSYRNMYHESLTRSENNYYGNLCDSLKTGRNERKWWATIKQLMGRGNNYSYPPIFDPNNNCYVSSSQEKATLFNNFFLSHSDIDTSTAELPLQDNIAGETLDNIVATEDEVRDLLQCLDVNKATGHDGISAKMLKSAGQSIVSSLTKLINICIDKGKMPNEWKRANVLPIHKRDNKDICGNYRPVSLLPILSKILEKLVFKYVYNFLLDHNVFTPHQSGFRPSDSTVNQLACLYHTFCEALDKKKDIRIIFCDISKAFDRCWHDGIIFKLKRIGITGNLLEFFKDYLHNRQQRVIISGQQSSWGTIKAGVPQGSVLGPLLFLIYINDLVNDITCDIKLYADDTTLFTVTNNHQEAAQLLNENLKRVEEWANQWLVTFNHTKTKLMTITLKTNNTSDNHPIMFGNDQLTEVSQHRHLGVELDSKLKWTGHVSNVIKSVSKIGDILFKLKYRLDRKTLQQIYVSFVRPKLEYASVIWDDCTITDKMRLENVQLLFARIITGAKRGTSHYALYKETSWPLLSERRKESKLKLFYKIINQLVPSYLYNLLPSPLLDNTGYNLRNRNDLNQYRLRTEKFRRSIFPDCIRLFNSLPCEVRNSLTMNDFSSKISEQSLPNRLFYGFSRKLGIIHAQFRMNCSNLNGHLFSLHVIDDPTCICSNEIENCEHFFFHCHMYIAQRENFLASIREVCNGCPITVNLLLFGNEDLSEVINLQLFALVETFIFDSNRFVI